MTPLAICVLAYCLIAEGHSWRCAPPHESDVVSTVERPLDYAQTGDLRPGFTTVEHRACARLANELAPPINHRLTEFYVRRDQRSRPAQRAAAP
jgi:hypothetical protein